MKITLNVGDAPAPGAPLLPTPMYMVHQMALEGGLWPNLTCPTLAESKITWASTVNC